MAAKIERKYALRRIEAGDYLMPSNDGKVCWRLSRTEILGLRGDLIGGWGLYKWIGGGSWPSTMEDVDDWDRWESWAECRSREDAIQAALIEGAPRPQTAPTFTPSNGRGIGSALIDRT